MIRPSAKQQPHVEDSRWLWLGPLLYMTVISLYFIGRFGGRWAEADSAVFTNLIRVVIQEGHLIPASGEVYPNGYAYQAITA